MARSRFFRVVLTDPRYATPVTMNRFLAIISAAAASVSLVPQALAAEPPEGGEATTEAAESDGVENARDPDEGIARPDAPDLRSGHFLISLSGGVWVPSNPLFPALSELGDPGAGGTAHLHLGIGLNRYMVLQLTGGFAMAPSAVDTCEGCSGTSIDAGGEFLFHPTQGFAFDPWIGYGLGFRHNILSLDTQDAPSRSAFDFARISLGGTYSPTPAFGFGPYLETDIGVRQVNDPTFYAAFHIGMKLTFDPIRAGATASPAATTGQLSW